MERRTLEENRENKETMRCWWGLRSPVLREDNADEESLAELAALVETAGGQAVGTILQSREKPDPHSFIGEGKVEEVRRMVQEEEATMVIFDNDPLALPDPGADGDDRGTGAGPQRPDPGHLCPAGQDQGGGACRWSWPSTSTCCPG